MAYTQADLDAIDRAIALGARVVRFSDNSSVEYRSLEELRTARSVIDDTMAAAASTPRPSRMRYAAAGKGIVLGTGTGSGW